LTTSVNPDLARWNEKYRNRPLLIHPQGEPELINILPADRGGLALEIACGRGAHALYLATLGYDVIALDGAIEALGACHHSANFLGLPVFPAVVDLENVALPENAFDFISVVRYLQRSLSGNLKKSLRPGGRIFYKTFNRRFLIEKPGFNPNYVLEDGELLRMFPDLAPISYGEEGTTSFLLAERPADLN